MRELVFHKVMPELRQRVLTVRGNDLRLVCRTPQTRRQPTDRFPPIACVLLAGFDSQAGREPLYERSINP